MRDTNYVCVPIYYRIHMIYIMYMPICTNIYAYIYVIWIMYVCLYITVYIWIHVIYIICIHMMYIICIHIYITCIHMTLYVFIWLEYIWCHMNTCDVYMNTYDVIHMMCIYGILYIYITCQNYLYIHIYVSHICMPICHHVWCLWYICMIYVYILPIHMM